MQVLEKCIKKSFDKIGEPLVINYRVNAGFIPKEHWTQNEEIGGGRIKGEVCHFIDLMQFFTGALPNTVYAHCIHAESDQIKNDDNIIINLNFDNGSVTMFFVT